MVPVLSQWKLRSVKIELKLSQRSVSNTILPQQTQIEMIKVILYLLSSKPLQNIHSLSAPATF